MTIEDLKKKIKKLGLRVDSDSGEVLVEWEKIPFSEEDRPYWAALSAIDGAGPMVLPMLISCFGSARQVFRIRKELLQETKVNGKTIDRLLQFGKQVDIQKWHRQAIQPQAEIKLKFLVPADAGFPQKLLRFSHGPSQLWVWGEAKVLSAVKPIAVVGTRKITPYGKAVTTTIAEKLAQHGCVIVSGLMYGVDEVAMRAALKSGGKVIGVWAGGLTRESLGSRFRLACEIVDAGGAVVSEFSFDKMPFKGTFPSRNRIVSGLSLGVAVTEGAIRSGSLITANHALEQGRPVGAVPGSITSPMSAGPNELLKLGATPITSAEDILTMCGISVKTIAHRNLEYSPQTEDERIILQLLAQNSMTTDELVRTSRLLVPRVSEILTNLELENVVRQIGEEWQVL